jgi:hypothetical protein
MAKVHKKIDENLEGEIVRAEVEASEIVVGKNKTRFNIKKLLLLLIFIGLAIVPSVYLFIQYQDVKFKLEGPKVKSGNEITQLTERIGRLMDLPSGEMPRLATVTDENALFGKLFFAKARNGDKVLVYPSLGKAIFYRESINKIVDIAFVSIGSDNKAQINSAPSQNEPKATLPARIKVLNGTLTSGLAKSAVSKIQSSLQDTTMLPPGDSLGGGYTTTIVVDINGKQAEVALQIAKLLNGKVQVTIPDAEAKPEADILVILGEDYVK